MNQDDANDQKRDSGNASNPPTVARTEGDEKELASRRNASRADPDKKSLRRSWRSALPPGTPKWIHDPIAVASVVIAGATVVNLVISLWLWQATADSADVTRRIFEAANRPYVGIENIEANKDEKTHRLFFIVRTKNFGTVPAEQFDNNMQIFLGDDLVPTQGVPDKPKILFPGQAILNTGLIGSSSYDALMAGTVTLRIVTTLTYKGPEKEYPAYCNKSQYDHQRNVFVDLGACK